MPLLGFLDSLFAWLAAAKPCPPLRGGAGLVCGSRVPGGRTSSGM